MGQILQLPFCVFLSCWNTCVGQCGVETDDQRPARPKGSVSAGPRLWLQCCVRKEEQHEPRSETWLSLGWFVYNHLHTKASDYIQTMAPQLLCMINLLLIDRCTCSSLDECVSDLCMKTGWPTDICQGFFHLWNVIDLFIEYISCCVLWSDSMETRRSSQPPNTSFVSQWRPWRAREGIQSQCPDIFLQHWIVLIIVPINVSNFVIYSPRFSEFYLHIHFYRALKYRRIYDLYTENQSSASCFRGFFPREGL